MAFKAGRYVDAELAATTAITLDGTDAYAFLKRAHARLQLRKFQEALADADAGLAQDASLPIRAIRAFALFGLNRVEEAIAEADRAVATQPSKLAVREVRAEILAESGRKDAARQDWDVIIASNPSAAAYVSRALLWPSNNHDKRELDVTAALHLDPHFVPALQVKARDAIADGAYARAAETIALIDAEVPGSLIATNLHVSLATKQGRLDEALALLDANVARHPNQGSAWNERCWFKATMNVQIATAAADCETAVKFGPMAASYWDSLAFLRLKQGHNADALATYNKALAMNPQLSASLYGRGIARERLGDAAGAAADLAAARRLSPDIDAQYAAYGVQPRDRVPAPRATAGG